MKVLTRALLSLCSTTMNSDLKTARAASSHRGYAGSLLLLLTVLCVSFPVSIYAQLTPATNGAMLADGSISGSLAPAPNAKLPISNVIVSIEETGDKALVDRHGEFTFSSVKPGTYTLVATGDGFSRLRITDVVVQPNREVTLGAETMPVIMKDGELQVMEEIVVTAKKEVQTMNPYLVQDVKPEPFSDRNVDLPRGIDDVQPYYIFDSQTIEESGTTDVEDFLKQRLTMDTTAQTNSQITLYQSGPTPPSTASSINLNGLGTDHTLILVNGLPMAGVSVFNGNNAATPGQPDVNGIPLGAIDRIEVLPSSAGAIYGAGAEGGVINIVLKKAYNGGDITATYASTWDGYGPTKTIAATFGKSFENGKTQLFVVAQYSDESPMFVQDRLNLLNRGYSTLMQNDPAFLGIDAPNTTTNQYYPILGSTPNFASAYTTYPVPAGTAGVSIANQKRVIGYVTGSGLSTTAADPWVLTESQPLTLKSTGTSLGGANPYIATLPAGYSLSSNPSSIIGGQWNLSPGEDNESPSGLLVPLGNYPRRKSLMATLTRQMTSKLQLHIDFSNYENHSYSDYNPLNTAGSGPGQLIPASDPYNPFNQAIRVVLPIEIAAPVTSNTITTSVTLGGTVKLPYDWIAHLDYQWSQSAFDSYYAGIFNPFGSTKPTFNSTDNYPTPLWTGTINPFVDNLVYPINWAPFTYNNYNSGKTTANDLVLAASGPLFHLPWGDPRLSIRLEHNKTGEPGGAVDSTGPSNTLYPGIQGATAFDQTLTSFGETQTTDSANAELDLPIFKSKLPLLRALDAQLNFSNETSTVWTGTPGTYFAAPALYQNSSPGLYLLAPNSIDSEYGNLDAIPSSGAKPIRIKAVSSNTGFTGPALSYKPIDDIIIRASVASGYVPPTYTQLLPSPLSAATANEYTQQINDPRNPSAGQYSITEVNLGGNPNLKPETAKSWNVGAIWEPKSGLLKGFRADAE